MSTNQGGVLGFTLDMPSAKHRDTRSPIMMPIGEWNNDYYYYYTCEPTEFSCKGLYTVVKSQSLSPSPSLLPPPPSLSLFLTLFPPLFSPPSLSLSLSLPPSLLPTDKEFNQRRNHATIFAGVIDSQSYLLDVNDQGSYHGSPKGTQHLVMVTEDAIKCVSLPNMKRKHRVKIKQSDSEELHAISAHYLRVAGKSRLIEHKYIASSLHNS